MSGPEDVPPIKYGPYPYHTHDNPLLETIKKRYSAPTSVPGDMTERTTKAAALGAGMGIFYQLVYFPWFFNDPIEISGTKSKELIRSQWPRFLKGFGRPMFWFTSTAVLFSSTECIFEGLLSDNGEASPKTTGYAGFVAGFWLAATTKRIDTMFLTGACTGAITAMAQFNGMSYVSDPKQYSMTLGGKRPLQHEETKELAGLKEKYPKFADL